MTQVSLSMKQRQTHGCREQTVVAKGPGAERGGIGSLGLADANCYLYVQMNAPEANATS